MDLCTVGVTFQRAMTLVLRGLEWEEVIVYLDDVIVLGTNFSDTLSALHRVLDHFRLHKWKLKLRKSRFFKEEVEFLDKMISGNGTFIALDKLEAVKRWPVPQNAKELMSFLGFELSSQSHAWLC